MKTGNNKEEAKLFASRHYTIEYTVTSLFDGTTVAPTVDFSVPPSDPDNVYRPAATARLGVIAPDVGSNIQGPRTVDWIYIDMPSAASAGAALRVVDIRTTSGVPGRMEALADFEGHLTYWRKNTPIILTPGMALQIEGTGGFSAATPARVRMGVSVPNQAATMAMLAALMDQPGYLPNYYGVRDLVTGAPDGDLLGVEASYLIVPEGFEGSTVVLPQSAASAYWGQGEGRDTPIRCGRRYYIDNFAAQSFTITRQAGDTINDVAADYTVPVGGFYIITSTGRGDWRVISLPLAT